MAETEFLHQKLWPAMWMLPRDEVYGPWPLSGEIDMVESRGNNLKYTAQYVSVIPFPCFKKPLTIYVTQWFELRPRLSQLGSRTQPERCVQIVQLVD